MFTLLAHAHAFLRAIVERRFTDSRLLAADLAKFAGFVVPTSPVRSLPILSSNDNFARLYAAAAKLAYQPSVRNFTRWQQADVAFCTVALSGIERIAKTISPTVRAPEPAPPIVRRCCPTSLEWQTNPSIGTNPAKLVEFSRRSNCHPVTKSKPKARQPRQPRPEVQPQPRPHCVSTMPKLSLKRA